MSQTELIMIDDTDPGISYTGNWVPDKGSVDNMGNYGAPYMSTNHVIKGTGSFTYTFYGSYVGIFGTTLDSNDPVRTCTVDGTVIPNHVLHSAQNMIMHCEINHLPDGKHTIVVNVPSANANGYWFDYLMYIPSASVPRANAVITILSGDPSMVYDYDSGFSKNGPGRIATVDGAKFSMQFTGTGRSLTWFGYYQSQLPTAPTTATWTLDGGTPMTFNLNGGGSKAVGAQWNQRFFTTGILSSSGPHNLQVVYNGNSDVTPLSVYQVIIQNGASTGPSVGGAIGASTPSGGSSGGNSGTGSSGSATTSTADSSGTASAPVAQQSTVVIGTGSSAITVTVSANSTATQGLLGTGTGTTTSSATGTGSPPDPGSTSKASSASDSSSSPAGSGSPTNNSAPDTTGANAHSGHSMTGPIVGAVVGVIALLLLLLLAFFIRRRRSRKRAAPRESIVLDAESRNIITAGIVSPFTDLPSTPQTAPMTEYPAESSKVNLLQSPNWQAYPYTDEKRKPSSSSHALSPSMSTTFSSPSSNPPETGVFMLHQHQDSGVRLPLAEAEASGIPVVEMPPTYSAT